MKKVLVTGGAGFIGSNLCEALYKSGLYQVYSLDNYFTGSKQNHIDGVIYLEGSTVDIFKIVNFNPDIIFHFGEYSRVEQSFDDIETVMEFNTTGTFKVLEFVRKSKAKLIYSGSSTKFADDGLGPNQSPYAWTKSKNTELVINYSNWFKIKYAIVYFYNAFGPKEISQGKYATLIALFNKKMKNGLPLTVVKPGTQQRNFTHVFDIVSGLMLVAEQGEGDGYGIGNDQAYSVLEIAQFFGGHIEMLPERPGNRLGASVKNQKIKDIGWSAKHQLKDYINELKKSWSN